MKQPSYRSRIRGEAFYKLLPIFVSQVPAAESGLQIPAGRIKMYSYEEVLDQIENGRRFGNRPGVEITGIKTGCHLFMWREPTEKDRSAHS